MFELRDYQSDTIEETIKFLSTTKETRKGIIVAPCGSGKSVIIANLAIRLKQRCLVLQPSVELLTQNYNKYVAYGYKASIFSASLKTKDTSENVIFATIGSIKNLGKETLGELKYIILDECHLFPPESESMIKQLFNRFKRARRLGLTATPFRLWNGTDIEVNCRYSSLRMINSTVPRILNDFIKVIQIKDMYDKGYLCPIKYYDVPYKSKLLLNSTGSDYTDECMKKAFIDNQTLDKIKYICCNSRDKINKGLIFVTSIDEAELVASVIPDCKAVTAHTSKKDRVIIIDEYKRGKIKYLVNVATLTTGFDVPDLDMIIIARPTISLALYMQILGRGIRPYPGKKSCAVFDLVGNHKKFGDFDKITVKQRNDRWGIFNCDIELTNQKNYANS